MSTLRPHIQYSDKWTQQDQDDLDLMFIEAKRLNMWFYSQNLTGTHWFSPDELDQEQAKGNYLWGKVNWTLKHPETYLRQLLDELKTKSAELDQVRTKMRNVNKWIHDHQQEVY
jgi:hypothetical protein